MLLRVTNLILLVLSGAVALVSLTGFIGWAADASANKWSALLCCVIACGAFAFFWSLHRKGAMWKMGIAPMSPTQQSQQGLIGLAVLIFIVGAIPYELIAGKPASLGGKFVEYAVLCAVYAASVFAFARTKGVK